MRLFSTEAVCDKYLVFDILEGMQRKYSYFLYNWEIPGGILNLNRSEISEFMFVRNVIDFSQWSSKKNYNLFLISGIIVIVILLVFQQIE
ncbi:MAG: hypothetical protein JJU28_17900 [Cyclobacteriaceae bacterium]|nr:hypothetical protein [Cyclobacteriaceae bacterium]